MYRRFVSTRAVRPPAAPGAGTTPASQLAGAVLEFHFDQAGSRCRLVGEVDAFTVADLHRALRRLASSGQVRIDIERAHFLNHRALLELAIFGRDLAGSGGHLVIEGARPAHRRLWTLLGLDGDPLVELA